MKYIRTNHSHIGPDKFWPECRCDRDTFTLLAPPKLVTPPGHVDYFLLNKSDNTKVFKKRIQFNKNQNACVNKLSSHFAQQFLKGSNSTLVYNDDAPCMYIVISKSDGTVATLHDLSREPPIFKESMLLPRLRDCIDGLFTRKFFLVSKKLYLSFRRLHKGGIKSADGYDDVVAYYDREVRLYCS